MARRRGGYERIAPAGEGEEGLEDVGDIDLEIEVAGLQVGAGFTHGARNVGKLLEDRHHVAHQVHVAVGRGDRALRQVRDNVAPHRRQQGIGGREVARKADPATLEDGLHGIGSAGNDRLMDQVHGA